MFSEFAYSNLFENFQRKLQDSAKIQNRVRKFVDYSSAGVYHFFVFRSIFRSSDPKERYLGDTNHPYS